MMRRTTGVLFAFLFACVNCTAPSPPMPDASDDVVSELVPRPDAGTCVDNDNDGHPSAACGGDDCDDSNPRVNPGIREVCDNLGVDEDCDPCTVGESLPNNIGGDADRDEDGFPSRACFNRLAPGAQPMCTSVVQPADAGAFVRVTVSASETRGTDCDDNTRSRSPAMSEVCDANRLDENCNGTSNEGCLCTTGTAMSCADTFGECSRGTQDCIDGRFAMCSVTPVDETCDGRDNDCDGDTDEMLRVACYRDRDSDGFGDSTAVVSQECGVLQPGGSRTCPGGFTAAAPSAGQLDCNDNNALQSPRLAEIPCNNLDDDCNAATSDTTCAGGMSCTAGGCQCPSGQVLCAGRCQAVGAACTIGMGFCANNAGRTACTTVGATQSVTCTGAPLPPPNWYPDCDGDTHGNPASTATPSCVAPNACGRPMVMNNTDCSAGDADPSSFVGAAERCDGVDNNCNGQVDDGFFCARGTSRTENVIFAGVPATCSRPCNSSCSGHDSGCTTGGAGHDWNVVGSVFSYMAPGMGSNGGDGSFSWSGTMTLSTPYLNDSLTRFFSGATRYTVSVDYAINSATSSGGTLNVFSGATLLGSVAMPNTGGVRRTVSTVVTMPGAATAISTMNIQVMLTVGGTYSPITVYRAQWLHSGTEPYLF